SYDRIEAARGIQWPYSEEQAKQDEASIGPVLSFDMQQRQDYLGNRRLYTDGQYQTDDGRGKLLPIRFVNNNECPDGEYPFWLNSGRVVEHFHTRTRTGKIGNCNKFSPTPYMEMNPDAAQQRG